MLPHTQRLSKNQVSYLLRKGSRLENEWFRVKYLVNRQKKSRFAIVLSNKVIKLATNRNHLRRRLYAMFEKIPNHKQHYDIIMQVKKAELANKLPSDLSTLIKETVSPILK